NELFSGPGKYWLADSSDPNGGYLLRGAPAGVFQDGCTEVFRWLNGQVEVALRAAALAGRHLRVVSGAVTIGQVESGFRGDLANPCFLRDGDPGWTLDCNEDRNAFSVDCTTAFANRHNAAVDLHLHYETTSDFDDGVTYLLSTSA